MKEANTPMLKFLVLIAVLAIVGGVIIFSIRTSQGLEVPQPVVEEVK